MTIGASLTIAAIAIVAFALCHLVHEVIGHGLAVLFVPGVSAIYCIQRSLDQATGQPCGSVADRWETRVDES